MEQKPTPPSQQKLIQSMKETIELRKVQVELQQLNTELAKLKFEEIQHYALIGRFSRPEESQEEKVPEN